MSYVYTWKWVSLVALWVHILVDFGNSGFKVTQENLHARLSVFLDNRSHISMAIIQPQ